MKTFHELMEVEPRVRIARKALAVAVEQKAHWEQELQDAKTAYENAYLHRVPNVGDYKRRVSKAKSFLNSAIASITKAETDLLEAIEWKTPFIKSQMRQNPGPSPRARQGENQAEFVRRSVRGNPGVDFGAPATAENVRKYGKQLLGNEYTREKLEELVELVSSPVERVSGVHPSHLRYDKMNLINKVLGNYGVESIVLDENGEDVTGSGNIDSAGDFLDAVVDIMYSNTGDSYALTIMFVNGRLYIGDWGSIVEKYT